LWFCGHLGRSRESQTRDAKVYGQMWIFLKGNMITGEKTPTNLSETGMQDKIL